MNYLSIGDMAQAYQMRRHNLELKTTLSSLTSEVTTGVKSDLGDAVSGDFTALAGIDRSLTALSAYKTATTEAELSASTMQRALGTITDLDSGIGVALVSAGTTGTATIMDATLSDAATRFSTLISTLNINVTGRYLFSGAASDTPPLPAPDTILTALRSELVGATDAADVIARIDSWFDDPAGFEATIYSGAAAQSEFRIANRESISIEITANDPQLRDTLKGYATAALLKGGLFAGDLSARSTLSTVAGERIVQGDQNLAVLSADLGTVEAKIADAATRNDAERSALELARSELIAADPYESASALEAVRTQLETLYTLTARLSSLSMTDFMR